MTGPPDGRRTALATASHVAAGDGNLRLADRLLALGTDRELRVPLSDATPFGWAEHFSHRELIDLLSVT